MRMRRDVIQQLLTDTPDYELIWPQRGTEGARGRHWYLEMEMDGGTKIPAGDSVSPQ